MVNVPADSPNLTAVGGSSLSYGAGLSYGTESWWNDSQSGAGGFGTSKFFSAPYQTPLSGTTARSVPDVVANADPAEGVVLCQADNGGCPNGGLYGGTSLAAPMWAAFTALLNQSQGTNLGFLNPLIYPLAGTAGFHGPASIGQRFCPRWPWFSQSSRPSPGAKRPNAGSCRSLCFRGFRLSWTALYRHQRSRLA